MFYHKMKFYPSFLAGQGYSKCLDCGKVIFESNDDSANAICLVKTEERERLRRNLEKSLQTLPIEN